MEATTVTDREAEEAARPVALLLLRLMLPRATPYVTTSGSEAQAVPVVVHYAEVPMAVQEATASSRTSQQKAVRLVRAGVTNMKGQAERVVKDRPV